MSLNSWLCDWCGNDGEGYVTVGGIVSTVVIIAVFIWLVLSSFYGGYIAGLMVSTIYQGSPINAAPVPPFWEFPLLVFVITFGGVLWVGGWYVLSKIAAIRVAKCELKKGKE